VGIERSRFFRFQLRREGARDRLRLERDRPELAGLGANMLRFERELESAWMDYVENVSRAEISCTLGGAALLAAIAEAIGAKTILDLGSGFSSYVFRCSPARVKSVDDDPRWLENTRAFLVKRSARAEELVTLDALGAADQHAFDLVFYDLGSMSTRERYLELALSAARPGGLVVLDDCHKARYWRRAKEVLAARASAQYSLRSYACDIWGRFAVLAIV
jgi:predicted O-methyltransferase YrrM